MTDQCKHCSCKGDMRNCLSVECSHHETWYAKEQQKRIDAQHFLIIDLQATLRVIQYSSTAMMSQCDEERKRIGS